MKFKGKSSETTFFFWQNIYTHVPIPIQIQLYATKYPYKYSYMLQNLQQLTNWKNIEWREQKYINLKVKRQLPFGSAKWEKMSFKIYFKLNLFGTEFILSVNVYGESL